MRWCGKLKFGCESFGAEYNLNLRGTLIGFRIVKKGLAYVVNLRSMVDVKVRNLLEI